MWRLVDGLGPGESPEGLRQSPTGFGDVIRSTTFRVSDSFFSGLGISSFRGWDSFLLGVGVLEENISLVLVLVCDTNILFVMLPFFTFFLCSFNTRQHASLHFSPLSSVDLSP